MVVTEQKEADHETEVADEEMVVVVELEEADHEIEVADEEMVVKQEEGVDGEGMDMFGAMDEAISGLGALVALMSEFSKY